MWSSSNPLEKTESTKQTKSFNKAPAQGEIRFADEGRTKLHSLITCRRPSVSSGAPQQLCYQHGLPKGGISWQPRCLHSASDKVDVCLRDRAQPWDWHWGSHSAVGCRQESLTLPCPSGPTCKHLQLRAPVGMRAPAAVHTHCALPKDLHGTPPFSSTE